MTLFRSLIPLLFFLLTEVSLGATYYVATNGNDSNSCAMAQNPSTPKRKIMGASGGVECLTTPGDRVYVRQGTYDEAISNRYGQLLPSGTSWENAYILAAYPGETVTLTQPMGFGDCCGNAPLPQMSYWIIDGFRVVYRGSVLYNGHHADHIRFSNLAITNNFFTNAAVLGDWTTTLANTIGNCLEGRGDYLEFVNVEIYNCGAYGAYFYGNNSLFDHIKMHDVYGYGFHLYHYGTHDVVNNTIRNSEIYNVIPAKPYGTYGGPGILLSSGYGNQAYNNVIHHSGGGIGAAYGSDRFKIFNNTIYNVTGDGITVSNLSSGGATIINNIVFGVGGAAIIDWTNVNPVLANNLCGSSGYGCALVSDPRFVNASVNDFHLQATSPAIDAGSNLFDVLFDRDGIARPQGAGYDIGAYELASSGTTPTPTPAPTPTPTPAPPSDMISPTVTIMAPVNGATVNRGSVVTITANASDNVGIARVEFYLNGVLKCSDTVAEYSCVWKVSGKPNAIYSVEVRAYDSAGNVGKAAITVRAQ
jgi:hypothetical protein